MARLMYERVVWQLSRLRNLKINAKKSIITKKSIKWYQIVINNLLNKDDNSGFVAPLNKRETISSFR